MSRKSKSSNKIRYAVVGLGHIAQVAVLPAFKNARNSELVSLVSGEKEKRDKLGKKYRLNRVYSYEDYDRALREVDAVFIAVPNHLAGPEQFRLDELVRRRLATLKDPREVIADPNALYSGLKSASGHWFRATTHDSARRVF